MVRFRCCLARSPVVGPGNPFCGAGTNAGDVDRVVLYDVADIYEFIDDLVVYSVLDEGVAVGEESFDGVEQGCTFFRGSGSQPRDHKLASEALE